jgi:enoyl-CoA hydratase/carnithine racemase
MAATKQATRRKDETRAPAPPKTARDVEIELRAGILIATLARPERRNSLSEAMLAGLQAAIDEAGRDTGVRAVVIAAKGPALCAQLMRSVVRCPKPVIAAVQGTATAAGCQLVASCDLAVAAETAAFATPGVNIGLFCSTPMVALSRNVPRKRAMEMLLLGEMLPAHAAAEYGLVNRVVAPGKELDEALAMAALIATKPAATLAIGKEAFYRQVEMALADAYDYAAGVMVTNMMHAEAKEGIGAFLEKRPPDWSKSR